MDELKTVSQIAEGASAESDEKMKRAKKSEADAKNARADDPAEDLDEHFKGKGERY